MSYPYNNNNNPYGYQQIPQQNYPVQPPYPLPQQPLYPVLPNNYNPPTTYHPQYLPQNNYNQPNNYGFSNTTQNVASYLVNNFAPPVDPLSQPYQTNTNNILPPATPKTLPPYSSYPQNAQTSPLPTPPYASPSFNQSSLPPQNLWNNPYGSYNQDSSASVLPTANFSQTQASAPPLNSSGNIDLKEASAPPLTSSLSMSASDISTKEENESNLHSQFGDYVISYSKLQIGKEIGKGAFGVVYKGRFRATDVAIKQLIKNESIELQEFIAEAQVMKRLPSHPNVVLFRGITVPPDPITLITDFCDGKIHDSHDIIGGSLLGLLSSNNEISYLDQLRFISEIAAGMDHLHNSIKGTQVIHRDLAARNILLKSGHAMVSDFGMARLKKQETGSHQTKQDVGPLKWMPPESLQERIFSTKSDVFSFAVVIIEIMTRRPPWPDLDPVQAAFEVVKGGRTPIPPNMPNQLKEIVELCWSQEQAQRPEFSEICDAIAPIFEKESEKVELQISSTIANNNYASVH